MRQATYVFTAKEILDQIHYELIKNEANFSIFSLEKWKEYVLARAIEDVLMVDLTPEVDLHMEYMASLVRSSYRRKEGDELYTLHKDVGTNKLYRYIGSDDLPFESQLELHRYRVTLGPREISH